MRQESPRSRQSTIVRQGRPLWKAEVSWSVPNTDKLAKLRYYLEALDGFNGSVQIWDFTSFKPDGLELATSDAEGSRIYWTHLGAKIPWTWAGLPSHWMLDSSVPASAARAIGATTVAVSGLEASRPAVVQGQYVQVGRRLYLAAAGASSTAGGAATITLASPLLSAVAVGDPIRLVEGACEMELVSQEWGAAAKAGDGFVRVSATFRETVGDKS